MARTTITAKRRNSAAHRADKFLLYQETVQEPVSQCAFLERVYRKEYGQPPRVLREDFCGTALLCSHWVTTAPDRRADGYDIDQPTLEWGERHNLGPLSEAARARVRLVNQDVRAVKGSKADVISAENFSYFIFRTRDELRGYMSAARRNLARQGLLVMDIMGGAECYREDMREDRRMDGFKYIWEHERFDPITSHCRFNIHFRFRDGSQINRAFTYDWRLWTIPEVRELMLEAGFSRVDVYWEGTGKDGEGNGSYRRRKHAEADPSYIAYVVAVK